MIRARLKNAQKLLDRLKGMVDRLRDLSEPLQQAGLVVRDAAIKRFKEQGGDQTWAPNTRGGHTGIDSGRLMGSISVSKIAANAVVVGTNLFYARWFQEGTGIFAGHQPWLVTGKPGKGIAFTIGGKKYVRREVVIPGQPSRPFLVVTDTERAKIRDIFQHWFMQNPNQGAT